MSPRWMLGVVLLLTLFAGAARGQDGDEAPVTVPDTTLEERQRPRVRAALSLAGAAGLGFASGFINAAPGLSVELGALFNDTVSVVARATITTLLWTTVSHLGVSVDRVLSDHVCLGVGLAFSWLGGAPGSQDLPVSSGISLPVRISWMFSERAPTQRIRHGVYVFGEAVPGVSLAASRGFVKLGPGSPPAGPPLMISAVLGVGYGWW